MQRNAGLDVDLPLFERAGDCAHDVFIASVEDRRKGLEDCHRGSQIGKHRRELAADGSAADYRHGCRKAVQGQHFV